MAAPFVELHLQDELPTLGSGIRRCVTWEGRKWVYLFYPPTLETVKLPKGAFTALRPREVEFNPSTVRKIIRRNRKARAARNAFDGGESAKKALDVLKGAH
jgi:hypothetical protein